LKSKNGDYESLLVQKNVDELRQVALQWRASAYIWEYRYLNKFLVLNSQRVLEWFSTFTHPIDAQVFDGYWRTIIPVPNERLAILDALKQHLLIAGDSSFQVTPKGKEYLEVRGPLPK
jgi:hypothetical protein